MGRRVRRDDLPPVPLETTSRETRSRETNPRAKTHRSVDGQEDTAVRAGPVGGVREIGVILRETAKEWLEDEVPGRGAALAYYVLLSLGPALVLIVGVLELFLNSEQVRVGVIEAVYMNVGADAADTVATVLQRVEVPDFLSPEALVTVGLLLFGATAVFANVQSALDAIWNVTPEEDRTKREVAVAFLLSRLRGFLMVVFTGVVLTLSFAVTSVTGVLSNVLQGGLPYGEVLVRGLDGVVSLLFTGLLFGAIYRTLPTKRILWSTVWVGAFITALIFVLGKFLVAWLIASASWTSYYGPGATVVTFLAWIYFSSQLFFLGAEFTQVWSRRRGGVMSESYSR